MIKRIATLVGLIGLAYLLILAAALTRVEVGKVRKEFSDHATEAKRVRQDILRLFGELSPPPSTRP